MSPARSQPRRGPRRLLVALLSLALAGSVLLAPLPAAAQSSSVSAQRINASNVYELAAKVAGVLCSTETGSHSVALASGENWICEQVLRSVWPSGRVEMVWKADKRPSESML